MQVEHVLLCLAIFFLLVSNLSYLIEMVLISLNTLNFIYHRLFIIKQKWTHSTRNLNFALKRKKKWKGNGVVGILQY